MASDDSKSKPSTSSKQPRKRKSVNKMSNESPKKPRLDRVKNEKYKQLVRKSIKRLTSQEQPSSSNAVQQVVQEPPPERPPTRRGQVEFNIDRRSPDILIDKPLRPKSMNERRR